MNSDHNFDKFLDDALREYSAAEPRAGLEGRILANLRAAPAVSSWYARPAFAAAVTTALCAMLYGIWTIMPVLSEHQRPPIVPNRLPAPVVARTRPRSDVETPRHAIKKEVGSRETTQHQRASFAAQLPAPEPLSEQEKLLLALARENPKEIISSIAWQEQMRRPPETPESTNQGEQQ